MRMAEMPGIEFQVVGNVSQVVGELAELANTLKRVNSAAKNIHTSKARKEFSSLHASVTKAKSALSKLSSGGFKLLMTPIKKITGSIKDFSNGLKGLGSRLGRIAMYRAFRAIIKNITEAFQEGVKHAYEWSRVMGGPVSAAGMTLAQAMDDIATSTSYLKNSIGAAVAPLISALAPAIRVVTDAAVECLNAINQLIARLTGAKGWTRAIRKAEEYGDAVGGAGGAAKKALEYLAPFDELNVLPDPKSGGGGGGGEDYSGMFEEMTEFSDSISDFADRIRDAFERSDWQGLGTLLGEKFNDLVSNINWAELGVKVGDKIRMWFSTEYWTLKTIDFQGLGGQIAEFLNNMLAEINFSDIGGTIAQKITMIPEMIIGAINNLDFGTVGGSLGDLIRGFLDDITDTIEGVNWAETVDNLISGLDDAIKSFDIGETVKSILHFMGSVISAVTQAAGSLLIDLAAAIVNPDNWALVGAWLKDLPAMIKQVGIDIVNNFVAPVINGVNNLIDQINERFGKNIPHIEFQLLPNIPEDELHRNFNEAKQKLQQDAEQNPVAFKGEIEEVTTGPSVSGANKPTIASKADFTSYGTSVLKGGNLAVMAAKANFTAFKSSISPSVSSKADFGSYKIGHSIEYGTTGKAKIDSVLNVTGQANTPTIRANVNINQTKAAGGAYYAGSWHDIPQYASGGRPHGSLFLAGEAGAEIVGHVGGRTEVLNRSQLASTMYAAVRGAMSGVRIETTAPSYQDDDITNEDMMYRAFSRALAESDRVIELDGDVVYRKVVQRNRLNTRSTGVNAMA